MAALLPRIVHAVFSLLLCFVGVTGIYVLAGADFLAITQIVVYVGGVLVLIAFGILLTGRTRGFGAGSEGRRSRKLGLGDRPRAFLRPDERDRRDLAVFRFRATGAGEGTTAGIGRCFWATTSSVRVRVDPAAGGAGGRGVPRAEGAKA